MFQHLRHLLELLNKEINTFHSILVFYFDFIKTIEEIKLQFSVGSIHFICHRNMLSNVIDQSIIQQISMQKWIQEFQVKLSFITS